MPSPAQIRANRARMEARRAARYTDAGYRADDPMFRSTLNPDTKTRLEFTEASLACTCPPNAYPEYVRLFHNYQRMIDLLGHHPAMQQNNTQTYNTPAISKNKVYFMWDFMHRTFGMMNAIPDPSRLDQFQDFWDGDIKGRTVMGVMLIKDTTGRLDSMNQSVGYNHDHGIEFGPEILSLADEMLL